ncbi:MAG: peptidase M64, partial [Muribaculaceae bacterium]|nr:peptidase M64 [Muribaculaceae bacterium]
VFEGGGYQSRGVYRPAQECRMKVNEVKDFCPVCARAIRRITDFYTAH